MAVRDGLPLELSHPRYAKQCRIQEGLGREVIGLWYGEWEQTTGWASVASSDPYGEESRQPRKANPSAQCAPRR